MKSFKIASVLLTTIILLSAFKLMAQYEEKTDDKLNFTTENAYQVVQVNPVKSKKAKKQE